MILTVLNDNAPGYLASEHGLSFLIEDKKQILFDAGPSDIILRNADKAGINLNNAETVVLSHGHFDHGNGLEYLKNKTLICHPEVFIKRYRKKDHTYIGLPFDQEEAEKHFDLNTTKKHLFINDHMVFLGEIPRVNNFEAKATPFEKNDGSDDFVLDDSGLAVITEKGLIVVSGCGHAGIVNMIEHAKNVTDNNNVYAVIGGFHLKKAEGVTQKVISYMKKEEIKYVYPSHCTELPALAQFHNAFGINQLKSGDVLHF
jgi:7,8-dihydropterin-6-yl-methyl-4-(beta-D-ribofuranosyl)aminobenzene 5'-phosphate synthase